LLVAIRCLPGHTFWPDSISVADEAFFASEVLSSHSRVTDSYLLALAHVNGGSLATMDTKLATEPVPGARATIEVI
jgi:hypothetical protein